MSSYVKCGVAAADKIPNDCHLDEPIEPEGGRSRRYDMPPATADPRSIESPHLFATHYGISGNTRRR